MSRTKETILQQVSEGSDRELRTTKLNPRCIIHGCPLVCPKCTGATGGWTGTGDKKRRGGKKFYSDLAKKSATKRALKRALEQRAP
jgi:hypothetical protein